MTAMHKRSEFIKARQRFGRGEIGIDDLYAAADAYIAELKAYKQRTGDKKLSVPNRAKLMRAPL